MWLLWRTTQSPSSICGGYKVLNATSGWKNQESEISMQNYWSIGLNSVKTCINSMIWLFTKPAARGMITLINKWFYYHLKYHYVCTLIVSDKQFVFHLSPYLSIFFCLILSVWTLFYLVLSLFSHVFFFLL